MSVQSEMARYRRAVEAGLKEGIEEYAAQVRALHYRQITEAKGNFYVREGRIHRASAPGDPPAPDTKTFLEGIETERIAPNRFQAGIEGPAAEYAERLEDGDDKIAPRPLWRKVIERAKRDGSLSRAIMEGAKRAL